MVLGEIQGWELNIPQHPGELQELGSLLCPAGVLGCTPCCCAQSCTRKSGARQHVGAFPPPQRASHSFPEVTLGWRAEQRLQDGTVESQ